MITSELLDDILLEWSYRLKDGIPDVNDPEKVKVLNDILIENKLPLYETKVDLKGNTDIKEGLVCLFYDMICTENSIINTYNSIDLKSKTPNISNINKFVSLMETVSKKNDSSSRYGDKLTPANLTSDVKMVLNDIKSNKDQISIINNAMSAAIAIFNNADSKFKKPGLITRYSGFSDIRDLAVSIIAWQYLIPGFYPDNWCPGDVYIPESTQAINAALNTENLNVGADSLNAQFYGTAQKGGILAVSLKQESARAGKGTTFSRIATIKDVNSEIDPSKNMDDLGADSKALKTESRRVNDYLGTDSVLASAKKDPKLRAAISKKITTANNKILELSSKYGLKTTSYKILFDYQKTDLDDRYQFLIDNREDMHDSLSKLSTNLQSYVNGDDSIEKIKKNFKNSHDQFETYLNSLGIKGLSSNVNSSFINDIKSKNKNAQDFVNILVKKTDTYQIGSKLIETWIDENKDLNDLFKKISKIKNPFIALTLFAIAQAGINPPFFKAIGKDTGAPGEWHEFPTDTTVKEMPEVEKMQIIDSATKAGFQVVYDLNLNNHVYKTTLDFTFSEKTIKIEVARLKQLS